MDLISQLAGQLGVDQLPQQFGLDGAKAALVGPIALDFLKDRMSAEWLDMALKAAPLLAGGDKPASPAGGAAATLGALGGLFGGD